MPMVEVVTKYFVLSFLSVILDTSSKYSLIMGLAASRQEAFWEACGFGHVGRARKFLEEGDIDVNWVSYVVHLYFHTLVLS